jgi:hypothetical protein
MRNIKDDQYLEITTLKKFEGLYVKKIRLKTDYDKV